MRAPLLLSAVAFLSTACTPSSGPAGSKAKKPETGEVVATIGSEKLTLPELQKKLDEQSPFVRARYTEPEKKQELLDAQVRFEVLAAEARSRGFADDPEVEDAIKKIIVQRLTREEFDGRVQLKDITDTELEKYFTEHKADYQKPEMVRASVVSVAFTDATKAAANKTIVDVQKQAADPKKKEDRNAWKDLVTKFSTDEATKPAGGDLRYLSRDEVTTRYGAPASEWLFASDQQNEVSAVFEASSGFHVFKRTGKRKAIERTFDQVKNQIKNVVYREKRTAAFNTFVDELKKKYGVKLFPEHLAKLKVESLPPQTAGADDGHGHGGAHGAPPAVVAPVDDDGDNESGAPKGTAP
ncbi:MAG: peptidyl-prolyl cis-trans isomerase [Deltaproteobacteria bacterium]|nr:peptidyl-prolyl cis-trans isomerase [Deltaproteobacteria bacterium]